jgi:dienelactone hydrolase
MVCCMPFLNRRLLLSLMVSAALFGADDLKTALANDESAPTIPKLLPKELPWGSSPGTMLRDSLLSSANQFFDRWDAEFEMLQTQEMIDDYRSQKRQRFLENIGGLPPKTPLSAKITGTTERDGYRIEKVLFQSQPDFYVTACLFLPDPIRFPPPWPAVVVVCGHSADGKLQDGYQRGTALAAVNGVAAMIVDPIGQGERLQILETQGQSISPTTEHTLVGTGAILVGWNTARWMVHDGTRAIDYLQSRPDIRHDRIGVMGNSGGGTQTSYLMALDWRVAAAAPSCYLTTLRSLLGSIGPQDAEQNIYGQVAWGMDHSDYLLMRAPKPTLIACATNDYFDIDGTWTAFRRAKRIFTRLGNGRHVELVEVDAPHGWHPLLRVTSVQFMRQHLAGSLEPIDDPEIVPLSDQEMMVTPEGQVLRIPGARSAFDHVREESERLRAERLSRKIDVESLAGQIRVVAAIGSLDEIPTCEVEWIKDARADAFAKLPVADKADLQPLILRASPDIWLPGVLARPKQIEAEGQTEVGSATCMFLTEGFASALATDGQVLNSVQQGKTVLAVDLSGVGETRPTGKYWYSQRFGINGGNAMLAYLLSKSLVGLRTEEMLSCARWLIDSSGFSRVNLVASGELTSSATLAGFLHPELIDQVAVRNGLQSWTQLAQTPLSVNQIPNVIHGVLKVVDLPELAQRMGDRITVIEPL